MKSYIFLSNTLLSLFENTTPFLIFNPFFKMLYFSTLARGKFPHFYFFFPLWFELFPKRNTIGPRLYDIWCNEIPRFNHYSTYVIKSSFQLLIFNVCHLWWHVVCLVPVGYWVRLYAVAEYDQTSFYCEPS